MVNNACRKASEGHSRLSGSFHGHVYPFGRTLQLSGGNRINCCLVSTLISAKAKTFKVLKMEVLILQKHLFVQTYFFSHYNKNY